MDLDLLARHVGQQRWFSGKGRDWQPVAVEPLPWLRDDRLRVRVELLTVAYPDGARETYQLPLVYRPEPVDALGHAYVGEDDGDLGHFWVYDALHDKEVTDLWVRGIVEGREVTGDDGRGMSFHRDRSADDVPLDLPSLVMNAEQSNTSLVFGDALILKVLRKASAGSNPDIELTSALARAGSTHIAPPVGWVDGRWPDRAAAVSDGGTAEGSLAILQRFLRNASEGWGMATASVRDLLAEADLHAHEVGGDFAAESHRLGIATAEVHADLARVLSTGVWHAEEIAAWVAAMRGRLERAVAEVGALAPYAEGLRTAYDAVERREEDVPVQRVHGDYHLGQVLRALDGWKVLDFEGEPAKPLAERRALDSPLKDVAGMLRSFDYAARQLLVDQRPEPQRDYRAAEWVERNRDAFCTGYAEAAGRDPRDEHVLLAAFETDKMVYETVYEARHRPSWLRIPLAAAERLAADSPADRRTP